MRTKITIGINVFGVNEELELQSIYYNIKVLCEIITNTKKNLTTIIRSLIWLENPPFSKEYSGTLHPVPHTSLFERHPDRVTCHGHGNHSNEIPHTWIGETKETGGVFRQ